MGIAYSTSVPNDVGEHIPWEIVLNYGLSQCRILPLSCLCFRALASHISSVPINKLAELPSGILESMLDFLVEDDLLNDGVFVVLISAIVKQHDLTGASMLELSLCPPYSCAAFNSTLSESSIRVIVELCGVTLKTFESRAFALYDAWESSKYLDVYVTVLCRCPNLLRLLFNHENNYVDNTVVDSICTLKSLQELALPHSSITEQGMCCIVQNCTNLTSLNLEQCNNVTDKF